jgi:hypothetical protein
MLKRTNPVIPNVEHYCSITQGCKALSTRKSLTTTIHGFTYLNPHPVLVLTNTFSSL